MSGATVQDVVLGHILPDIGRRHRGVGTMTTGQGPQRSRLGSPMGRTMRAYAGNAQRVPQSVVKRVTNGGTHTRAELKRQLAYVTREEGVRATWTNQHGIEREIGDTTVERTVQVWADTWRGAPKRGHTDHIILSFPRGTDVEQAEEIAREWGRAVFMSGDFGDRWRYVAGLHQDTDHVHAHFVVDKRGIDEGRFLSISNKADLNYGVMREMHAEIAGEHGLELAATTRRSRGLVENAPREVEYRAAHAEGRKPETPEMSAVERMKREAEVRGFARRYREVARMARLMDGADRGFIGRMEGLLTGAAEALEEGVSLMASTNTNEGQGAVDPAARLGEALNNLKVSAQDAWESVRGMEPSAERVELERTIADEARGVLDYAKTDPWFSRHAESVAVRDDPYAHSKVAALRASRETAPEGSALATQIDREMDGMRERLEAGFAPGEDKLQRFDTTSEEMAARHMLGDRSVAQLAAWRDQSNSVETVAWLEEERRLSREAQQIVAGYELPRELEEDIAKDQLTRAGAGSRLSAIPAVDSLVRRVGRDLSPEDREALMQGDTRALSEEVKDPTLRAVVASEMRNGATADIEGASRAAEVDRRSETVDQFQAMARQNDLQAKSRDRSRSTGVERDVSEDYGL